MELLKGIVEKRLRPRHEEDIVDRTNYVTTPFILATAAIISFAKEYGPFSEPITCWTQAEWNDQWLQYAHDFCFVESTYYVAHNETIPMSGQRNRKVSYYQWLPFILVAQALVCQMPNHFWRLCNTLSNKSVPSILRQAHDAVGKDCERSVASGIGQHLLMTLMARPGEEGKTKSGCIRVVKKQLSRNGLSFLYLLTKCLYLLNNICQFLFISIFLGVQQTPQWGIQMLDAFMTHGTAWERNGLFPRVSLCDFKIRMPGNRLHEYTVQCVLMANFLNEKIFLTIYYWFVFMALLTVLNLLRWCWLLFRPPGGYVRRLVQLSAIQVFPDPDCMLGAEKETASAEDSSDAEELTDFPEMRESDSINRHSRVSTSATTSTFVSSNATTPTGVGGLVRRFESPQTVANFRQERAGSPNSFANVNFDNALSPFGPRVAMSDLPAKQKLSEWEKKMIKVMEKRKKFNRDFEVENENFTNRLGTDGILIFQLIRANAGPQMASLMMGQLFDHSMKQGRKGSELAGGP